MDHHNLKQNMHLHSKQSSLFSFYALPSGGKSKDAVVDYNRTKQQNKTRGQPYSDTCLLPSEYSLAGANIMADVDPLANVGSQCR